MPVLRLPVHGNQWDAVHDSHLPLRKWFMAIALICEAKKSLSAMQLSRHFGVQHKTAWYLNHRIREAMQDKDSKPLGQRRPSR